jgi:hypothetical protein
LTELIRGQRQHLRQEAPGVAFWDRREILRRSLGNDPTSAGTALGSEVDQMICSLDDVEVVFDHQHRVPLIDESTEHGQETPDVLEM